MSYRFDRYGRSRHLRVETAAQLRDARDLDPALWVSTSMPTKGVFADDALLGYLDTQSNGRIIHREVIDAIDWLFGVLSDYTPIDRRSDVLDPATLDPENADAAKIIRTVERIAEECEPGTKLDLVRLRELKTALQNKPVSDAGVVLPSAATRPEVIDSIRLAIRVTGGAPHPSGESGINSATLETFLARTKGFLSLKNDEHELAIDPSAESYDIYRKFRRIIAKIDEYLRLCAEALFVGRSATAPDGAPLESLPLAKPDPEGVLRFDRFVNPAYFDDITRFRDEILARRARESLDGLSAPEWSRIRTLFSRAEAIDARRIALGDGAAQAMEEASNLDLLITDDVIARIHDLIAESDSAALTLDEVRRAEKLVVFQRFILELAGNFISFPDLYDRSSRAWFEMGKLVLDNRTFHLAVLVENRPRHITMARNSSMYVLYLQVRLNRDTVAYEVACPVTAGGKGNLAVGKRGIFTDRKGIEYDAEIVEIIENPISIREAIISPFRRLGKTITGKLEAMTSQADQQLQQFAGSTVEAIGSGKEPGSIPASPAVQTASLPQTATTRSGVSNLLFGGSIAVAALGSAIAYITNTLSSMKWWQVLVGFGIAFSAVILPAVVVAIVKLRKRDMGAVIEASGWAVNVPLKLTRRLQRTFTARPKYPKGARGVPLRSRRWFRWLLTALFLGAVLVALVLVFKK